MLKDVRLSVLDLAPIRDEGTIAESFENSVALARRAEELGYHRFWLAEHHNIDGIASAATAVLIGHIAGRTSTLRVGSGGVMLPNHAPLVVAEQFGTLATLYPDRIDLGLGRAPGTDGMTLRALGRDPQAAEHFPQMVQELAGYLGDARPGQRVKAVPGQGTHVPLWLLGSSGFSAQLAAKLGLPFAFASHFAPGYIHEAIRLYRDNFQPSSILDKPYLMLGIPVIAAETDEQAEFLSTTHQQKFLNLIRGKSTRALPPVKELDWHPHERGQVMQMLSASVVGSRETVKRQLASFIEGTGADELMINSDFYNLDDRLRSYEIVMDAAQG
ncbi:LLM class flavin-dependent oxidoreductase [Hydrocarboniclastica marina]|uniref:Luciferase-like monooxygenase n=1 Tax=Hydrocarboniclastica marina TaxID=2259620 RepID=A0A4P7XK99_9ALTE|nr:LLM class flavin-dependent oxidoreductase [Hydrocarboniclastica marina]MAM00373.1 LLM class flavin-dependent oxidoreductase [Alteromonadaceae bacterium]QCF27639.1 LLM class flavin-dependent oxidoreductase [Hydrocarboniclastica marina]|tara:strand:+ start:1577 stop:2563 length:987 start_codon:yes stop_codon:yes gene_type:complete